jgi:hypothetical protein
MIFGKNLAVFMLCATLLSAGVAVAFPETKPVVDRVLPILFVSMLCGAILWLAGL